MAISTSLRNYKFRLLIWMNMPTHHQSAFFAAIRETGIDLVVHYYSRVSAARKALGWDDVQRLPPGERFVTPEITSANECLDWRDRIHIVPGYGSEFLRDLVRFVTREGCVWLHWSEPAHPGVRWWTTYPLKMWYARVVNEHALAALAIGDLAKIDFMRWGIEEKKISILPYAIEAISNNQEIDSEISAFSEKFKTVFLFLGVLCRRKGVDVLLDAFSQVTRVRSDTGLLFVGKDTSNGRYCQFAQRRSLGGRVLFRGMIPAKTIGSALQVSHVIVLPSRFDGWGMVLNEAASLGKPLIATDACGSAFHLIKNGENGFRVRAGDSAALADAMMRYASDPELVHAHGQRSRSIFREFTPEKNADRLRKILAERINNNPRVVTI